MLGWRCLEVQPSKASENPHVRAPKKAFGSSRPGSSGATGVEIRNAKEWIEWFRRSGRRVVRYPAGLSYGRPLFRSAQPYGSSVSPSLRDRWSDGLPRGFPRGSDTLKNQAGRLRVLRCGWNGST